MTPNSDGPDLSQWNPVGDWDAIPQFRLFSTKATGSASRQVWQDPTFDTNWTQMRRRGFEFRGCYHWVRSDVPMADQVAMLRAALEPHGGLQVGEFIQVDWETTPGIPYLTVEQITEFVDLCEWEWSGRCIVYASDWVPGFLAWREANPQYPLWYANYRIDGSPFGGWAECAKWGADVWQWTSSAAIPGVNDPTCDMNHVFRWETFERITRPGDGMYPDGYGTREITFEQMRARHEPHMHPEFARRFFAYIESQGGFMGVGGGYRPPGTQPDGQPGFAPPGRSFHEGQAFPSGVAYAAVDLVVRQPGRKHRSPTWAETAGAPDFGLHTFITGEPWHIQPIELRGHGTWVAAGRPDLPRFTLPGDTPTTPPATDEVDMIVIDHNPGTPEWTAMSYTGTHLAHVWNGHADVVLNRAGVARQTVTDAELDGLILSATTTTAAPPAWAGTPRAAAWTAQRG